MAKEAKWHACRHVLTRLHTHTRVETRRHVETRVDTCLRVYTFIHVYALYTCVLTCYTHVDTCLHVSARVSIHTQTCRNVGENTCRKVHTCLHAGIHVQVQPFEDAGSLALKFVGPHGVFPPGYFGKHREGSVLDWAVGLHRWKSHFDSADLGRNAGTQTKETWPKYSQGNGKCECICCIRPCGKETFYAYIQCRIHLCVLAYAYTAGVSLGVTSPSRTAPQHTHTHTRSGACAAAENSASAPLPGNCAQPAPGPEKASG